MANAIDFTHSACFTLLRAKMSVVKSSSANSLSILVSLETIYLCLTKNWK